MVNTGILCNLGIQGWSRQGSCVNWDLGMVNTGIYSVNLGPRNSQYRDLMLFWDLGMVNTGIYHVNLSNRRFDPNRMLPADSYLSKWIGIQQHYYSGYGFQAVVSLCL